MAAQFTLTWDNTAILANVNAISQRALYRKRLTGGAFISTGFSPANDLPTSATTTNSINTLVENAVYQFKIQTLCTLNGPSDNNNGVQEQIKFLCIDAINGVTPGSTAAATQIQAIITKEQDIIGAEFTLYDAANTVLIKPTVVGTPTLTTIEHLFTGLTPGLTYTLRTVLIAIVNGSPLRSDDSNQLTTYCSVQLATEAAGIANLKFEWVRSADTIINLAGKIDGTFDVIDWGDGTINTSTTHNYTGSGNFKVEISGSNAVNINLSGMNLIHLTAVPNTVKNLNCQNNTIDNYPDLTSTALDKVYMDNNKITNTLDFSGTPNITELTFSNNLLAGVLDISMLVSLTKLIFSYNTLTSTSDLNLNTLLQILRLDHNSLSGAFDISLLSLITLDISFNSFSGTATVDVATSLKYINLSNNQFTNTSIVWGFLVSTALSPLYINATVNAIISATNINNILIGLDSGGGTNGTLLLVGQSAPTPPTGLGIIARTNLIGKSWSVTTD